MEHDSHLRGIGVARNLHLWEVLPQKGRSAIELRHNRKAEHATNTASKLRNLRQVGGHMGRNGVVEDVWQSGNSSNTRSGGVKYDFYSLSTTYRSVRSDVPPSSSRRT